MKTKHTEGKWMTKELVIYNGETGLNIAHVGKWAVKSEEEAMANAKLIAAAPEMLKTLQMVIKEIAPHFYNMGAKKAFSELVVLAEVSKVIHNATE